MNWTRSREMFLDGTTLAVCAEYRSPYWFVYDTRDPSSKLGGPCPLRAAKEHAERIAKKRAIQEAVSRV